LLILAGEAVFADPAPDAVEHLERLAIGVRWEPDAGMPHVRFCAGGAQ
jgi:hypothetical protein